MRRRPRILVTGFSAFPGAPVNPTERLIAALEARRSEFHGPDRLTFAVLAVDYGRLPAALGELAKAVPHDIAIHFGLSAQARGFTLERYARNAFGPKPDNSGYLPAAGPICAGPERLPSTLPLERLHDLLVNHGLPVSWSDDAGGYLCNYLFYLSRSGLVPEFTPGMSGFIHVPPLVGDWEANTSAMALDVLVKGAALIIGHCADVWTKGKA
ncbi:MAG TPA: hypothetical protein VNS34_08530 [Rhizobiaceae bacterium]|nr:hypothetical protein [Rhizobiaceae bacterium]